MPRLLVIVKLVLVVVEEEQPLEEEEAQEGMLIVVLSTGFYSTNAPDLFASCRLERGQKLVPALWYANSSRAECTLTACDKKGIWHVTMPT